MRAALFALAGCAPAAPPPRPAPASLQVTSADVGADGRLSGGCGCGPGSRTPQVSWAGVPETAASVAVLVSLRSAAEESVHWTAWDLDPRSGGVAAGVRPTQAPPLQGVTGDGRVGWRPVCGAPVDATVVIEVAALDDLIPPPPTVGAAALRARLAPHLLALGHLEAAPPMEATP